MLKCSFGRNNERLCQRVFPTLNGYNICKLCKLPFCSSHITSHVSSDNSLAQTCFHCLVDTQIQLQRKSSSKTQENSNEQNCNVNGCKDPKIFDSYIADVHYDIVIKTL